MSGFRQAGQHPMDRSPCSAERAGESVPAHRIVNAKGILSGAEAFETPETQKRLLETEGVRVQKTDAGWRVDLREYGWVNSIEEAEELYRIFQERGI